MDPANFVVRIYYLSYISFVSAGPIECVLDNQLAQCLQAELAGSDWHVERSPNRFNNHELEDD